MTNVEGAAQAPPRLLMEGPSTLCVDGLAQQEAERALTSPCPQAALSRAGQSFLEDASPLEA